MPLRIFRSNDERIVSIFMVRTSVGVHTRRPCGPRGAQLRQWARGLTASGNRRCGLRCRCTVEGRRAAPHNTYARIAGGIFRGRSHGGGPGCCTCRCLHDGGLSASSCRCCFGHRRFLPLLRTTATRVSSVLATSRLQPGVFIASGVDPTRGLASECNQSGKKTCAVRVRPIGS